MKPVQLLAIAFLLCAWIGCTSQKSQLRNAVLSEPQTAVASATNEYSENIPVSYPTAQPQKILRTIGYNVHLLPSVAMPFAGKRGAASYRAKAIAEQLSTYDLIGLSEAFDASHSQTIIDTVQSRSENAYLVARGPVRSGTHMIGSGLLLLTKYPMLETHTVAYKSASRYVTHGLKADAFAAKGALHVKLLLDSQSGSTLDCFLTHLESQSPKARSQQVLEFSNFVAAHHHPDGPILIMGDLNIAYEPPSVANQSTEYKDMIDNFAKVRPHHLVDNGLQLADGLMGSSDALASDGGKRIDYILTSNAASENAIKLFPIRSDRIPFLDSQVPEGSLSDHLAVTCEFQLVAP